MARRRAPAAPSEMDKQHGKGMMGAGDDWSAVKNSERTDRPLPRELVQLLSRKSDTEAFKRLAVHMCTMVVVGKTILWAVASSSVVLWAAVPVLVTFQGFLISAMGFAMQHECMHLTAFKTRRLNLIVGFLGSIPAFSFFEHELLMHKDHHTYTGDPTRDTELLSGGDIAVGAASKPGYRKVPESRTEYITSYLRLDGYLQRKVQKLVYCAVGKPVDYSATGWQCFTPHGDVDQPGTPGYRLKVAARLQLMATAVCLALYQNYCGPKSLCLAWLLPMLVGPAPVFFLQLHEHADCSMDKNGLTNTRTTITHPIISYFMWEMGYHAEHHLYTFFPFYQLPRAHKHLQAHLQKISPSHTDVNVKAWYEWIPAQIAGTPLSSTA